MTILSRDRMQLAALEKHVRELWDTPSTLPQVFTREELAALFDMANRGVYANRDAIVPMLLWCPAHGCGERHIDVGEFATKVHHTHACQACGFVWRPAIEPTVGVQFLPGFKDEAP